MVVVRGFLTTTFNAKSSELNNYFRLREVSLSFSKQINKPRAQTHTWISFDSYFFLPNTNGDHEDFVSG